MKPAAVIGTATAVAVVIVAGLVFALTGGNDDVRPPEGLAGTNAAGAVVSLPNHTTGAGDPELAGTRELSPEPGRIEQIAGPFDSRFHLVNMSFDGKVLRGEVEVTSDVSEIMALQVLGAFYDKTGTYLGENRFDFLLEGEHEEGGHPDETMAFHVKVPATYAAKVAGVGVGVTSLVNE